MTPLRELYNWVDTELKLLNYEHPIILAKIAELSKKEKQLIIGTFIQGKMDNHNLPFGIEYHNKLADAEQAAKKYYDSLK